MVLKDFKELVSLLNSLIIDLRTHIYAIDDESVREKLNHILCWYQKKLDKLESGDEKESDE